MTKNQKEKGMIVALLVFRKKIRYSSSFSAVRLMPKRGGGCTYSSNPSLTIFS